MKPRLLDQWPLDERDLSAAERERLERALAESPELQSELGAWQAIEASLRESPAIGPRPGFARRWRSNLAESQERRRLRLVQWLLGVLFLGAFAAMLLIGLEVLASPAQFGAAWIEAVIRIGQILETGARFLTIIGNGWPAFLGALALGAAVAWLSVLWVAAMIRYGFGRVQNGVS
ncbi:MAG: hypothetical protein BMS9Abin28_2194 [Anaerolineae bacterium]|nr:MAG: hypothetical protein BMS9Abin28_2194 [Anaerolineae bacterium]